MDFIKLKRCFKKNKNILLIFIITICIEMFVCNFAGFRTFFLGNEKVITNFEIENNVITIKDVGVRATSIYFDYKYSLTDKITYYLSYIPKEDNGEIRLRDKVILEDDSHYINFDTHSECRELKIALNTMSNIEINEIIINNPCFNINLYRILIIFSVCVFGLRLYTKKENQELYDIESKSQRKEFLLILTILCLIIALYTFEQYGVKSFYFTPEKIAKDDAILMQTEAFLSGQIPLQVTADERLLEMEDPYNYTEKIEKQIPFLYDVAYYDGNYYSYFGIAPIITLILPFRLITGVYTHTYIFNLVYVFGIIFILYDVYRKIINKFVKNISLRNFYLGYFAILFGANILTALRGAKYDIVMTSGIMFILLSISLAIRIGESEKNKTLKCVLLGITIALIVLSKPTYIVYYPLIVFFMWISIRENSKKENIKNIITIIIPLGIFAILQMIYNYLRFDNILEFGARYQFTSFNMNYCMSFSFGKAYAGILEYIFRTPIINPLQFPFVFINTNTTGVSVNEICYENRLYGLIAIPILWVFLFGKFIINKDNKDLSKFTIISLITTALAIVINTCTGGICEAYAIDFKCLLCINAIVLLLKNIENKNDSKESNYMFLNLCLITILLMIPISFTTENNWLSNMASSTTVFLRNIFEFWA